MRFVECLQGTQEWHAARCGVTTASRFADAVSMVGALDERQQKYVDLILAGSDIKAATIGAGYKCTPTSAAISRVLAGGHAGVPSDTAHRYAADLAIEQISGQPHGEPPKSWVLERGHEMEARARRLYEARTGAYVTEAGICLTDDGLFGYSTDGLVDDDGMIEIKAPIDSIKIFEMLRTGDVAEYAHQMHGGKWITGRKWCDFIQYVPELKNCGKDLFVKRIYRDDNFIDSMALELMRFQSMIAEYKEVFIGKPCDGFEMTAITPSNKQALVDQVATAALTAEQAAPAAAELLIMFQESLRPVPAVPPSLRLGQIGERLGFALTADFLRKLGFEPAGRDKAAVLYHECDFPNMCAALIRHINLMSLTKGKA